MSLLIKALEKAEQGKAEDANAPAGRELMLEQLDAGFSSAPHSRPENPPPKQVAQQQASAVFSAKQYPGWSMQRLVLGVVVIGILMIFIGVAAYAYWGKSQVPDVIAVQPASPVNVTRDPELIAEPAAVEPDIAQGLIDASSASVPEAAVPAARPSQPQAFGAPVAPLPEESAVKVTRNRVDNGVNPNLLAAYAALSAGDDNLALQEYRKVLQSDIRNVDALLGMAAVANRQARYTDAAGWYGKVLEIEPRNTIAQAALLSLNNQQDTGASESRIKSLLAQQPESAYLHAALGNLYASRSAWPAAQQAYFEAFRLDASNADYAFNLAVSLDQLGKTALALEYYKKARDLLAGNMTSVDKAQLDLRISQLEQH